MDTMTPIRPVVQHPRRISLTAGPAAAAGTRSHVRAAIHARHVPTDPHVAVLLTSELVTAIRHEVDDHAKVLLIITRADGKMHVEVHDTSRSEPVPVDAPPDAEAGRGLTLAASRSAGGGLYRTPAGQATYFTVAPQGDLGEDDDRNAQGDRDPQGGRDPQGDRRSLARVAASCGRLWY
jgi:hypothetical protein